MTDPRTIAAGLTAAQRKAMLADRSRGDNAYSMRTRMGTMEALRVRRLVNRVGGLGSMFSPTTSINWPLTALGLEVCKILQEPDHAK